MNLQQLLQNPPIPALEARMLMQKVTGLTRVQLLTRDTQTLNPAQTALWHDLCARRVAGEPMAYILGEREFYGRMFNVNTSVLIPRPDTETLVDTVLTQCEAQPLRVLDLGTGSGVIAVTLANERPNWRVSATDVSEEALRVAQDNAKKWAAKVQFYAGDWWQALTAQAQTEAPRFDVVVSNPPYICADDAHLSQGDVRFEPIGALTDGADGLHHYRAIVQAAPAFLQPQARVYFEHGFDQGAAVRAILSNAGFGQVRTVVDLGGNDRVSYGVWGAAPVLTP